MGTRLATQACALTGNRTSNPLVRRQMLHPLSHSSQGCIHHMLFVQLSPDGRLGCFCLLAVANNAAVNTGVQGPEALLPVPLAATSEWDRCRVNSAGTSVKTYFSTVAAPFHILPEQRTGAPVLCIFTNTCYTIVSPPPVRPPHQVFQIRRVFYTPSASRFGLAGSRCPVARWAALV